MTDQLDPEASEWLLAFADDEHLVGARHAAWIGLGPFLEEDLAFCSIAQDELGHALALYGYITEDIDRFALLRDAGDYRSAWLCEAPCPSWDLALVRHWLYDQAEKIRWEGIAEGSHPGLRELAARSEREEVFHRQHGDLYLARLSEAQAPGRQRVQDALDVLLPLALGLWDPVAGESAALAAGLTTLSSQASALRWRKEVETRLHAWGFDVAWPTDPAVSRLQQQRSNRSPEFAEFHASLQEVLLLDPDAIW